jgi:hypothetical protein
VLGRQHITTIDDVLAMARARAAPEGDKA